MVQKNDGYYFFIDRKDMPKFGRNHKMLVWYSILKDYSRRFKKDKTGYVRIPPKIYMSDYGISKKTFQRYNRKLEDKGLIVVDKVHRGGRTWAGFKLI